MSTYACPHPQPPIRGDFGDHSAVCPLKFEAGSSPSSGLLCMNNCLVCLHIGERRLENEKDNFEKGAEDKFMLDAPDLGQGS